MLGKKVKFLGDFLNKINPSVSKVVLPWIFRHPKSIPAMFRLIKAYKESKNIRAKQLENGVKVPPSLIISITSNCNLACSGCYAAATGTVCKSKTKNILDVDNWKEIIQEAVDIGVFGFVIAGGEPFTLPNLLSICEQFNDRLFLIFTNGTLIKEEQFKQLKKLRNLVIMVSIEGDQEMTDLRRGVGVYVRVLKTIKKLHKYGIISGISITINRNNFHYWMEENVIDNLISKGIRLGFFLEYIPVDHDDSLMLLNEESRTFREKVLKFREEKKIILLHSPGDEEYMGGCVSAGRSFAHITPTGDLTPCPVSNLATHNLKHSSLSDALKNPLFKIIRENEHLLEVNGSPCALFSHPEELNELIKNINVYHTCV